jgi:hypothetical protein
MIIDDTIVNPAEMSAGLKTSQFSIKATAKSFKILSSGLYKNKIKAIVRELSNNAFDSHVAAGHSKPIDVHLPTALEPYFYVKDYGTGLNDTEIFSVYTTYFESTKTGSNDYVGGLGLGSKSPFSYTDNFTVTSIKDGTVSVYSAFIDDSGVPSVVRLNESKTDEPNGVKVELAVLSSDIYSFHNEAKEVYKWFSVKPNFLGRDVDLNLGEWTGVEKGIRFKLTSSPSLALMGNSVYPIDLPKTQGDENEYIYTYYSKNYLFDFPIGDLDVAPSREELDYTKKTIDKIKDAIIGLYDRQKKVFNDKLDSIDNVYEKRIFLLSSKGTSNGIFLKSYGHLQTHFPFPDDIGSKHNIKIYSSNGKTKPTYKPKFTFFLEHRHPLPYAPATIFIRDNSCTIDSIHSHWKSGNNHRRAYFVLGPLDKKLPADYKGFLDSIYNPGTEIYTSSLNANTLVNRVRVKNLFKTYDLRHTKWENHSKGKPEEKSKYFIAYDEHPSLNRKVPYKLVNLMKIYEHYNNNLTIVGVKTNQVDDCKKAGMVNFYDFLQEWMNTVLLPKCLPYCNVSGLDNYGSFFAKCEPWFEFEDENIISLLDKKNNEDLYVDLTNAYQIMKEFNRLDEWDKIRAPYLEKNEKIKEHFSKMSLISKLSSLYNTTFTVEELKQILGLYDIKFRVK